MPLVKKEWWSVNILLVTPFMPPKIGGIERHSENIILEIGKSSSNTITVLTCMSGSRIESIGNNYRECNIVVLDSLTLFARFPIPLPTYRNLYRLIKLRNSSFDRLIVQSHLFLVSSLSAILFGKIDKRIWINHGSGFVSVPVALKIVERFFELVQIKVMKKRMNSFVSVSKESGSWISHKSKIPFNCISNSVPEYQIVQRESFPRTLNSIKLLFVGRLIANKGGVEAIKIFYELVKSQPRIATYEFSVIGEGPELVRMQKIAKDNGLKVTFLGVLDQNSVSSQMLASDILLFPSTYPEGLPTVILEGIAAGVLIATSSPLGIREFIQANACIYASVPELDRKILEVLGSSSEPLLRISRAEILLRNGYTTEAMVRKLLEL
jgi:glycosyltransferase involved in cell wall biosynthesis